MIQGLAPRTIDNILQYLTEELRRCRSERTELEQDWIRYAEVYRCKRQMAEQTWPFKGAARVKIPVAATDVDTTVAGVMGVLFGAPNLWSCEGLRPDRLDYAARLEEFLEWAQETELHMYGTVEDWVTEMVKLGTGVLKQRYLREERKMFEWRETPQGVVQQQLRRLAVNRPDVRRVPLANFYIPGTSPEIQGSPWVAERIELTWTQLENRVRAGVYTSEFLAKIGAHWRQAQSKSQFAQYQTAQEQLDNFVPGMRDTFEVFEFWSDQDLGDGDRTAVVCTIHEPSMSYARIDFNPFFNQEIPYSAARFLKVEGRFYGIGLCEMEEQIQEVITTMERQRLDNGTIRNTTLFRAKRNAGVKQDEPIWPGRIFLMDNVDDIQPMPMGFAAQDTLGAETNLINYARQRSSVSDWQRGGAGAPSISYSAATTTIEMLKQGRLRLDQFLRSIQAALSETGQRVVELYQQFDSVGKVYSVMGDKDGQVMQEVLQFPLDLIRTGVAVKVTATNASLNKETKIRTDQVIAGLVTQFYGQLFQGMSLVVNPQLPPALRVLAGTMVQGGIVLMRRILDSYGTQDLDLIVPDLKEINAITQQLEQIGIGGAAGAGQNALGAGPNPGGAGMDQGSPGLPPWMAANGGMPGQPALPGAGGTTGAGGYDQVPAFAGQM